MKGSRDGRAGRVNHREIEISREKESGKEKREMCARYVRRIPNAARIIMRVREREREKEPRTPPAHPLMYRFPSTI